MKFYSHAKETQERRRIGTKELKTHLSHVYHIASKQLHHNLRFTDTNVNIRNMLEDICIFHDLGKYTTFFQDYLLARKKAEQDLKKHSRIGAYCIANKYFNIDFTMALLSYYCIVNHHGNLTNIKDTEFFYDAAKESYEKRFNIQKNDLVEKLHQIQNELDIKDLKSILYFVNYQQFRKSIKKKQKNKPNIQDYFLINYLFSLLTESDKLDASETPLYKKKPIDEKAVDKYISPVPITQFPAIDEIYKQNDLRNLARSTVIKQLDRPEIHNHKLFTLTAPTGIGKTLISLDFALKLKGILREKQNYEAQIIYGLPFINIIEQALDVYSNEVFVDDVEKGNVNILAHYQYADIFGGKDTNEQEGYQQKVMQLDTWQSDIVITSFVQFFETLITNRNKLLKKFNHYAGSIIILDEIQTLKLDLMPLIGAVLYFLSKFLDARIILMTATQPKIFDLAQEYILNHEEEKAETIELLPNHHEIYNKFQRTMIIPLLDESMDDEVFFKVFIDKWSSDRSCLIVCNTVQRSIDLFYKIREIQYSNPVYYLSTNIIPAKRQKIIQDIRNDLLNHIKPVLVTTQVVEAGVDLDFDMGFRDIGPVDSIVQVAGRINRENSEGRKNSPLYVVQFQNNDKYDASKVYGDLTYLQAQKALSAKTEIFEKDYKTLVEGYFTDISNKKAFSLSKNIFDSMKTLNYDGDKENYPVSRFKIIEDAPWAVSVFVEIDEKAKEARKAFDALISKEITKEYFDKNYKQIFHQHIIAVPDYLPKTADLKHTDKYLTTNILIISNEDLDEYYSEETGFKRKLIKEESFTML